MAQMAVAWVLGNPNVSTAIVGASRPEQLADSVRASGVVLDADLRAAIDEVLGRARSCAIPPGPSPPPSDPDDPPEEDHDELDLAVPVRAGSADP